MKGWRKSKLGTLRRLLNKKIHEDAQQEIEHFCTVITIYNSYWYQRQTFQICNTHFILLSNQAFGAFHSESMVHKKNLKEPSRWACKGDTMTVMKHLVMYPQLFSINPIWNLKTEVAILSPSPDTYISIILKNRAPSRGSTTRIWWGEGKMGEQHKMHQRGFLRAFWSYQSGIKRMI